MFAALEQVAEFTSRISIMKCLITACNIVLILVSEVLFIMNNFKMVKKQNDVGAKYVITNMYIFYNGDC